MCLRYNDATAEGSEVKMRIMYDGTSKASRGQALDAELKMLLKMFASLITVSDSCPHSASNPTSS